jgi:hypothetical protein
LGQELQEPARILLMGNASERLVDTTDRTITCECRYKFIRHSLVGFWQGNMYIHLALQRAQGNATVRQPCESCVPDNLASWGTNQLSLCNACCPVVLSQHVRTSVTAAACCTSWASSLLLDSLYSTTGIRLLKGCLALFYQVVKWRSLACLRQRWRSPSTRSLSRSCRQRP